MKSSIIYFVASYALLSFIFSLIISFTITPSAMSQLYQHLNTISTQFPDDTEVIISNGVMSLNNNTPIVIPNQVSDSVFPYENLIIFNPNVVAQDINDLDSLSLITSKALAIQNLTDPDNTAIFNLNEITSDTTITKQSVVSYIDSVQNSLDKITPFLLPITFIGIFLSLLFIRTFFVLLFTVFSRTIGWLFGRNYTYQTYLKLSLHTIVIAEIVHSIHFLLFPSTIDLFPLALLGLNLIATIALPKTQKITPPHSS